MSRAWKIPERREETYSYVAVTKKLEIDYTSPYAKRDKLKEDRF